MIIKKFVNLAYKAIGYKNFGFYEIENMNWWAGEVSGIPMHGRYVDDNNMTLKFENNQLVKINGKKFKRGG